MQYKFFFLVGLFGLGACSSNEDKTPNNKVDVEPIKRLVSFENEDVFRTGWSTNNEMIFHVLGEPDDLHPTNGGAALRTLIFSLTQCHLLEPSSETESGVRPGLVERMPSISADGLSYTYQLRLDPTWDDGTPISVRDVIFTMKASKCPLINNPKLKPYIENLQSIEVSTEDTSVFTLIMKSRNLLNLGFLTGFPLLQEKYWDKNLVLRGYNMEQFDEQGASFDEQPKLVEWANNFNDPKYSRNPDCLVGLGLYDFKVWKPGQSFELVRKENHWSTQDSTNNGVDRIIFKINADPNSQMLEFKTQELDGSTSLSADNLITLQSDSTFNQNYNSAFFSNYLYSYLGFNCRPDGIRHKKLFDDVEVRKAIATAIPYDIINQIAYSNFNKRISGPVPPLKAESNSSIPLVKHDLVEAARILDEAGWIDSDGDNVRDKLIDGERVPFEFDLNYMVTPNTWKTTALLIAESLKEIGVRCNPQPLSFAVLRQKNRDHDFDAMLSAWSSSSFPEDYTQIWGTESWTKHGSNYVGFGNAASDMLIDSIKQETNLVRRKELSNRLQEMIVENQPYAFLFSYSKRVVAHKRFHNVQFGPNPPHVNLSEWVQNPLGSSDSQQDN